MSERMVANFCGPSGDDCIELSRPTRLMAFWSRGLSFGELPLLQEAVDKRLQNLLQPPIRRGGHGVCLLPTNTKRFLDDVPNPNLLKNIGWLYGPGNSDEKLIIGRRVFPLEERCRAK